MGTIDVGISIVVPSCRFAPYLQTLQWAPINPGGQWHVPSVVWHTPPFWHWHLRSQFGPYHPSSHSVQQTGRLVMTVHVYETALYRKA